MKRKPYNLLLLTGVFFLLAIFLLVPQNYALDIHLHDTYFVIDRRSFLGLLAGASLFIWALYLLVNKILYSKLLSWLHVIGTVLALLLISWMILFGESTASFTSSMRFSILAATAILLLLFAQLVFVVNFVAGLFHLP